MFLGGCVSKFPFHYPMEVNERFERKLLRFSFPPHPNGDKSAIWRKLLKLFCLSTLTGTKQALWTKTFEIFSVLTLHWRLEVRFDEVSENFFSFSVLTNYRTGTWQNP